MALKAPAGKLRASRQSPDASKNIFFNNDLPTAAGVLAAAEGSPSRPPRSHYRRTVNLAVPSRRDAYCRITTTTPTACLALLLTGSPPEHPDQRQITRSSGSGKGNNAHSATRQRRRDKLVGIRVGMRRRNSDRGQGSFRGAKAVSRNVHTDHGGTPSPSRGGLGWGWGDNAQKDGSLPHPPPNLPLEGGGVALAIRKVIELWGSSLVEIALPSGQV